MTNIFLELFLFSAKAFILVVLILILLTGILAILMRGKDKITGKISLKNLNKKYEETKEQLLSEIMPKGEFKKFIKEQKFTSKKIAKDANRKNIFFIDFQGDIRASNVVSLSEKITAILGIAKPSDEVVVRIESGGGMVHAYGLASAQLLRLRQQHIPLTVIIDKIAASGGYMMASCANKIIAAPFAIVGSIGVIVQLPNFNRLLKEKHIDFEQLTAGSFKRTLTLFGENTEEGRHKLRQEIEAIHLQFKNLIQQYRPKLDIEKVATGEHWLGKEALEYHLIDEINTSDDYLFEQCKLANIFEIQYQSKKSFIEKFTHAATTIKEELF